jgi:hypothetical protein
LEGAPEGAGVGELLRPRRSRRGGSFGGRLRRGEGERLVRRPFAGVLSCLGERLLLRSWQLRLEAEGGGEPKRACMAGWRVDLGGGLEPEEDVERAPVVMMTPCGCSP